MNYLAHIFLSGNDRQLQVGNFIGDFVKGRSHENYPPQIQTGILLHREIDSFTDSHPIFLETVEFMRPTFSRYSGIIADMYFDYLLASDFKKYSPKYSLNCFAANFYLSALLNYRHLPEQVKGFIFHFIGTNRLKKYGSYKGLQRSLQIMEHFKTSAINPELSIEFLKKNEQALKKYFHTFMPQAISHFR
ncbi:MAG: ACP phosphodiesterase [Bacteroidales bacterium]